MKFISFLITMVIPSAYAADVILCDVSNGLNLINQVAYSNSQIEMILNSCDKVKPNLTSVLLLHGLFERKNNNYNRAIEWLEKARNSDPSNQPILFELATTYEWNKQLAKAQEIYQLLLTKDPNNRNALLGLARIFRIDKEYSKAIMIYQGLLKQDEHDIDALNGLGWINAAQNNLINAQQYFNEVLKIQPQNTEAISALNKIKQTQLNILSSNDCNINQGLKLLNQKHPPFDQVSDILSQCSLHKVVSKDTLLLHGFLARKKAKESRNYTHAILWFKKAIDFPPQNDDRSLLELAITYEWANEPDNALLIYQNMLNENPKNRNALLGKARALRTLKKWAEAQAIYEDLLKKNSEDIDALNGLGWLALAKSNFQLATSYFIQSLMSQEDNLEALLGLDKIHLVQKHKVASIKPPSLCSADQGLILLNKQDPPIEAIEHILKRCDKNTPNSTSTLLLHGLLARYLGRKSQDYSAAISWLEKASATAGSGNYTPMLELAVTYEWSKKFSQAFYIYDEVLAKQPKNKLALLGKARILRFSYEIKPSLKIYEEMLKKSPNDIDVLSGLGETHLVNYDFNQARNSFNKILSIDPYNRSALQDLELLNASTRNIFEMTLGDYSVPPNTSNGLNLYYYRNLNATDALVILATHNTRQIQSGFGEGSALLPNNSLLLGYQYSVPNKYGWQLSYDARQHDNLPFEHRVYGGANLFLKNELEWFGGLRLAFFDPWNTQLLISGLTLHTSLPVNLTFTGFWAFQQIGGYNSSYALDFNKEYSSHLFYDFGSSYLAEQKSWEFHGKLIFPFWKNQAIVIQGSHYLFNRSTFITAGWRIYWA